MQEDFSITASPTGLSEGNVTLTGYFEYDWDSEREKLLRRAIVITNLDRTEFRDSTGITYKFASQAIDRSQIKQFEGTRPQGLGYRDTLHLIANILSTSNAPGVDSKREVLQSAEYRQMGDRYYESDDGKVNRDQ
ncbi:MAG TPA: hypothetical protein VLO30_07775 [Chthoniobacterales bacterium]|nr:hypothetical protein [Chthoniobacterales bacterium]